MHIIREKGVVLLEHDEVKRLPNRDEILIEEDLIQMDFSAEVARLLEQIHPPYADILTLRFYYELEICEIAKLLDITENNVSVRINRALTALKKVLVNIPDEQGRRSRFAKQNIEKEGVDYEQTI